MQIELDTQGKAQAKALIDQTPSKPRYVCVIEPYSKRRSQEQNARHWARMEQVAYFMCQTHKKCHDKETWHYYFAGECFGWVEVGKDGRAVPAHTKARNKHEFSEFDAFIDERLADWDIQLMEQDEWLEYKRAAGV